MPTHIYALWEPGGVIRYIGKTSQEPQKRLGDHLSDANRRRTHKCCWLRSLKIRGVTPRLMVIETVDGDGCDEERFHIALAKLDGLKLVNLTDGGDGVEMTPEIRRKISASHKTSPKAIAARAKVSFLRAKQMHAAYDGKPLPQYWRDNIAAALRGKPLNAAQLAGCSTGGKAMKGKKRPRWIIDKMVAASVASRAGKKQSQAHIAKRVAKLKGRKMPDRLKAILAIRNKQPKSPETRARIAASLRGRKQDPSHIAMRIAKSAEARRLKRRQSAAESSPRLLSVASAEKAVEQ